MTTLPAPVMVPPVVAPPGPPRAPDRPLLGIGLMVLAMTIVPLMDGLAKALSADYPVLQVVWARYFFHFAILLPLVLIRFKRRELVPRRPLFHVVRGGFLLVSTVLFFAAIAAMPMADAIALVFISPLVVTALSPLVLGEQVGPTRYSAVLLGCLGALIIVRPGFAVLQISSLFALAAGITYAFYSLSTRKLSGTAPPLVTLAYTALLGAVVMSLVVPFFWVTPDLRGLGLMALMGLVAAIGHFLVIRAFELASASLLAPYVYSEIVMTTIVGFVVFGDFPDRWTWIGVAVVIASGVFISLRETQLARRAASATQLQR